MRFSFNKILLQSDLFHSNHMGIPSSWCISLMSSFLLANVGELDTISFLLILCNLFMFNFFRTVLFYVFFCKKFLDLIPVYREFLCLHFGRSNGH